MIRFIIITCIALTGLGCGESIEESVPTKRCALINCNNPAEVISLSNGKERVLSYCVNHPGGDAGICDKDGCRAKTQYCLTPKYGADRDKCPEHVGLCRGKGCMAKPTIKVGFSDVPNYCAKCAVDLEEAEEAYQEKLRREAEAEIERRRLQEGALKAERLRRQNR